MDDSEVERGPVFCSPQRNIPHNSNADHGNVLPFIEKRTKSVCQDLASSDLEQQDLDYKQTTDELSEYKNASTAHYCEPNLEENGSKNHRKQTASEQEEIAFSNGPKLSPSKELDDCKNSRAASHYFFIDASSLNDDTDVTTSRSSTSNYPNDFNGSSTWSSSPAPNNCYIPSSHSNQLDSKSKLSSRQVVDTQFQYNDYKSDSHSQSTTEKSDELKKLEELRGHNDLAYCTGASKESLTVEIKEADSGESAQLSPCPDNTKASSSAPPTAQNSLAVNNFELENRNCKQEEGRNEDGGKPILIRRNTFELDADEERLSSLRQEYERRQGNLVFQNSITQYSQHLIDDDPSYFDASSAVRPEQQTTVPAAEQSIRPAHSDIVGPDSEKHKLDASEKESKLYRVFSSVGNDRSAESIVRSPSDRLLLANCALDEAIGFSSLPVSVNDEAVASPARTKLRRTDAAPIVSGGASSSDFTSRPPDSPSVRRKTESTPILSGGMAVVPEPEVRRVRGSLGSTSATTAWVVDMSDCQSKGDGVPAVERSRRSRESFSSDKSQHSSLGYFVNLEDVSGPEPAPAPRPAQQHRRRPSEPTGCEFFVALSDGKTETPKPQATKEETGAARKNMFSMFIDLSEPKPLTTRAAGVAKSSSSSGLSEKRESTERKPRSGVFMFIESDSPVVRRRTMSSSRGTFKRHSWNTDKSVDQLTDSSEQMQQQSPLMELKRTHKRALSLSVERRAGDGAEAPSTQSPGGVKIGVESSFEQPSARDTPPNSHVELLDEELLSSLRRRRELTAVEEQVPPLAKEERRSGDEACSESSLWEKTCTESSDASRTPPARKSETFDVSVGSTTGSSTSEISSTSNNLDSKLNDLLDATQRKLAISSKLGVGSNGSKGGKVQSAIPASFVRLSDLDKRPFSSGTNSASSLASTENAHRLSSSVVETSWIESKLVVSAVRTNDSLRKSLGKTLPLNIIAPKSDAPREFCGDGEHEATVSESDMSSLQSSMGRSGQGEPSRWERSVVSDPLINLPEIFQGSTEETETSTSFALGKPYNRLGEDLLRMFLEEINPDVTIDVGGQRIKAHKCILSSRCQYFAAILSGDWVENTGNIISLQGYSYEAVHFALCHIYSGESCIPESISIVELATLADMLCLEGLKEVIGFTLKVKYCHLFHKPCSGCVAGVLECMPLAAAYGLDEVYRKSLRWITRHFVRIWPTKEFATLPRELMEKCYHQHIAYMSADNVLQSVMDCDKLLTTLPNVRWAESVFRLVSNLLDASMKFLTDNFASVLGNESFQGLDREMTWNIGRLEEHLLAAAGRLPPEQACKSYSKLDKMFICAQIDDVLRVQKLKWSPIFVELMNKIKEQVEKCLIRDAARAARTNAWMKMDLELRRRVQELACLVLIPNEALSNKKIGSKNPNFPRGLNEHFESNRIPTSRTPPNRNSDLRRVKMAISEYNDRTLKQTPLLQTRKFMNKPKTDPLERKMQQNDKLRANDTTLKPKICPNKIEVKSRYLEPRNRTAVAKECSSECQEGKAQQLQRKKMLISSSDSSRTSSPAMKRAAERKVLSKVTKVPMKKDGKALSSDSLTESTSGRINAKKETTSKSCGMTRPESPLARPAIKGAPGLTSVEAVKRNPLLSKTIRMDTSMSADSLTTDIPGGMASPKYTGTNKSSPILGGGKIEQKPSSNDKSRKSPLMQQRGTPTTARRSIRSLESSTAASRSRAAATVSTYQGSLSLRKSLLDAAKAPDISASRVPVSSMATTRVNSRPKDSVKATYAPDQKTNKKEFNQRFNSTVPMNKRSPNLSSNSRLTKSSTIVTNKQKVNDNCSNKAKSQKTATVQQQDGPKFLHQSSRSGTFLKDEPTILNKSDMETAAIDA